MPLKIRASRPEVLHPAGTKDTHPGTKDTHPGIRDSHPERENKVIHLRKDPQTPEIKGSLLELPLQDPEIQDTHLKMVHLMTKLILQETASHLGLHHRDPEVIHQGVVLMTRGTLPMTKDLLPGMPAVFHQDMPLLLETQGTRPEIQPTLIEEHLLPEKGSLPIESTILEINTMRSTHPGTHMSKNLLKDLHLEVARDITIHVNVCL